MQTQQQTVTVLNANKLHKVSHLSHTAEVVMTALSQRERLRDFTDISRLKNALIRAGEKIVDEDYAAYWMGLQDAGVGRIVFSKKGKQDRFFWHYSMKKVAQAALEGKDIKAERINVGSAADLPKPAPAPQKKSVKLSSVKKPSASKPEAAQASAPIRDRQVLIPLRPDFCLEFTIPGDMTKEEVERVRGILNRLSA